LIIGSGHLTHNLTDYMRPSGERPAADTRAFRDWVHARLLENSTEANDELLDWQQAAPAARFAHPTPEHFLPLFVALGAAGENRRAEWLGGGWVEDSIAADNYLLSQNN